MLRADHVYMMPAPLPSASQAPIQFKLRDPLVDGSFTIDIPQPPFTRNKLSTADKDTANKALLQTFKDLAGSTNQVILKGAASQPQYANLTNHLNARIVSSEAMGFHLIDLLLEWEESVSKLLPLAHKHPSMEHTYDLLFEVACRNGLINSNNGESAITQNSDLSVTAEVVDLWPDAIRTLSIDIVLTCLNIKTRVWLNDQNACLIAMAIWSLL